AVAEAEADSKIRVIILTGAGSKAFVAGADISEFSSFSEAEGAGLAKHGHDVFRNIENCTKPVIAAINGFALGGGCELAMSCHLRVAATNAKFGQPELKLGLIPGYGGTQRLPMLIGRTKALELLMTADMIGAEEALSLGLVNYVTSPEELLTKCNEIAGKIVQQAPLAIAGIIKCVNAFYDKGETNFNEEIKEFGKCFITEDFTEGTTAFLEKRKANFKGK
ncbi:MAG TPA: enoyl-CoA hydratase-related protein, partial [Bacteroidia bacterium]|nr:enoyl-CoA hydratase-related protein [Bacteroidia bacterium]